MDHQIRFYDEDWLFDTIMYCEKILNKYFMTENELLFGASS